MPLDGVQLGRYRLMNLLGGGGMGEVYLAEDTHIHRQVAIKVIRAEAPPYPNTDTAGEAERLFRREIRAIATLDHPHILPLFDYGEETVHDIIYTYMVMPLRREGSLATWLRQRSGSPLLSVQETVHFIRQAASALSYAHRHQIIHQDVKPSNFLIRDNEENPGWPDLLLADFGIAKFHTATTSMSQASRGTPSYMAPEQWSGQPVPATDQYALAIMAYQLLTGRPPFQGRQEQVMYQHFNVPPPPPSKLNPRIPAAVEAVILRALAKKPEERFPSISAFARALQQAVQSAEGPTIEKAPNMFAAPDIAESNELRATLAISQAEAVAGTTRTLTLPGGRKVPVAVPANVADGHVIRLDGQATDGSGKLQALFVTIAIKHAEEERVAPVQLNRIIEPTFLSTPPGRTEKAATSIPPDVYRNLAQRFRGLPRGRAALLIGLVLLIVIGSLGTFYFRSFNYMQRMSLLNAAVANPYAPPGGTLALNDPLSDNSNGYFWYEGSNTSDSCAFTEGAYHASASQQGTYHGCSPDPTFSNFALEVQMTIVKGDYGGIIFRADSANLKFYYFRIGQDGSYELDLYTGPGSSTKLLPSSSATSATNAIPSFHTGSGQANLIAVVADGSTITLYVNNQKVDSVTDSTYSQGQIGMIADDEGNPTEVAFQNARVWTF